MIFISTLYIFWGHCLNITDICMVFNHVSRSITSSLFTSVNLLPVAELFAPAKFHSSVSIYPSLAAYWTRGILQTQEAKRMRGTKRNIMLPGFPNEFMWRERYGGKTAAASMIVVMPSYAKYTVQYPHISPKKGATKSCKRNDQYFVIYD